MKTESLVLDDGYRSTSLSLRDLIGLGFRRKRAIVLCFLGILSSAALVALWTPSEYTATTKFLVEHGRKDPVVSPQQDLQATFRGDVTEAELNSEVELLQTEGVLRQIGRAHV